MKKILDKIFTRYSFLNFSLFYLFFKYIFYGFGELLTYILLIYAFCIFIMDFFKNKGIYKFKGYIFAYLICFTTILSSLIVAHKIGINTIKGTSIFFINFFMYLPMFEGENDNWISKQFEKIFFWIIIYSFVINLVGVLFAIFGKEIFILGKPFGAQYGNRLVTVRETANETGWFSIFSIASSLYFLAKYNAKCLLESTFPFCKFNELSVKKFLFGYKFNIFLIVNIVIQFLTYILSGNRSSLFGVLFASAIMLIAYSNWKNNFLLKRKVQIISIFVLAIALFYVIVRVYYGIGSDSIRYDMYVYGVLLLPLTNLFLGSSFENLGRDLDVNFEKIWNCYNFKTDKTYLKQLTFDGNAHNVFIQQMNTNGIIGLVVLASFVFYCFFIVIDRVKGFTHDKKYFLQKMACIFFALFGIIVGNISWSIISTMTCFVNLMFFLSISALNNYSKGIEDKS